MKEVEVGGRRYRIRAPEPWAIPYLNLIENLGKKVPKSLEEAERDERLLKEAIERLVRRYVEPEPRVEDIRALLVELSLYVIELSKKAEGEARLFRKECGGEGGG